MPGAPRKKEAHIARPASARHQPPTRAAPVVAATCLGLLGMVLVGTAVKRRRQRRPVVGTPRPSLKPSQFVAAGSGMLATSVLLDSAFEHFKGSYANPAMYVAPITAGVSLSAAIAGPAWPYRRATGLGVAGVGAAGLAFHMYNITKRPGGLSWNNLFYAAPFGAPGALVASGLVGATRSIIEDRERRHEGEVRAGREVGALTSAAIFATTTEIALLHFRGAFHNPYMYLPVTIPPAAGAALALAASSNGPTERRLAQGSMMALGVLGLAGVGFHAYGVHRNMGGFANWMQTMFQGPPMAAPPSLTGLALAGIGAVRLLERR